MSISALDDYDSEIEYEDYDSEDFDSEAEDYDAEDRRSDAERRRRLNRNRTARRILMDRQRAQSRRLPQRMSTIGRPPASARQTVQAIKNLDLKNRVGEDSLRQSLDQANRRARMAGYVAATSAGVDQALDTFSDDLADHDLIRSLLRFAPLLLLSPQRTRPGFEGYLTDPRVLGGVAVAGLATVGVFRNRNSGVDSIEVNVPAQINAGDSGRFAGVAVDGKGRDVDVQIRWSSPDTALISVADNGSFTTTGTAGSARITAEAKDVRKSFFVEIVNWKADLKPEAAGNGAGSSEEAVKVVESKVEAETGSGRSRRPGNA